MTEDKINAIWENVALLFCAVVSVYSALSGRTGLLVFALLAVVGIYEIRRQRRKGPSDALPADGWTQIHLRDGTSMLVPRAMDEIPHSGTLYIYDRAKTTAIPMASVVWYESVLEPKDPPPRKTAEESRADELAARRQRLGEARRDE